MFYWSIYGLEWEETNFLTKYKSVFNELATIIDQPNVFQFWKDEMMSKINDYKKEPDLNPKFDKIKEEVVQIQQPNKWSLL